MATYNKINDWVKNAVHNADCESDQFAVALSNTAPGSEGTPPTGDGNGILGNVTQVAYTYLSSRNVTTTSSTQTAGTYSLVLQDLTLTSTGGSTGPFEYVYVYDDTVATPVKPLVCYYILPAGPITLLDGESLTIDFAAGGLFTIT